MLGLGVDVGSTNVKAVLLRLGEDGGRSVARASAPTPRSGTALVAEVLRLIAQLVVRGGAPACVGVASMAETGVPLDRDGWPIGDLVRWDGRRTGPATKRLEAALGADQLFAATGVRLSAKVPLAVWAHLRQTDPVRWAALDRWAGAADLVVLALTGRLATDHTLAGRTMAYRLPDGGSLPDRFDPDLLATVGLRPEQLPDVVAPGQLAGRVSAAGPGGLTPGTPVVAAGHDHAVGAWAAGVRRPGEVADSVGTAEAVVRVLDTRPEPEAVRTAGMSLVRTVSGRHDALVAGSPSAGAMLPWWADRYAGGEEADALLGLAPERPHPRELVVLPYLAGRQTPAPDPQATARLVGDPAGRDPADLAAALLDGLSLQARWMITAQAGLAGQNPAAGEVVVLGRAVRDRSPWLRTKAAVGPAVVRAVVADEPVAEGAALLAAARCGPLDPDATVLPTRLASERPEPAYDGLYAAFVEAASRPTRAV